MGYGIYWNTYTKHIVHVSVYIMYIYIQSQLHDNMNPRSVVGDIYETNPGLPKGEPEFDGNLKAWKR